MVSSWERWRGAVALVGAFILADLALVLFAGRPTTPASPAPPEPTPLASTVAAAQLAPPPRLVAATTSAAPSARPSVAWPEPKPIEGIQATHDLNYGDPFDSDAGRPRDIRVLTQVGSFRLGVTNDSKIRNERAVTAILGELGTEIDRKDKGREDGFERRVLEYQEIFEQYRGKLQPHMEGSFALKGNGWSDTEPLVRPEHRHREDHDAP